MGRAGTGRQRRSASKKRNGRVNRKKRFPIEALLGLLIIAGITALVVVYGCRTRTVTVNGSTLYSEDDVAQMLVSRKHCDNSLFFCLYYDLWYKDDFPLISSIHVKMNSLTSLEVTIKEKEIAGYVLYDSKYAYYDTNGTVLILSDSELTEVPSLSGFSFDSIEVGQSLPIEDSNLLSDVLEVNSAVKKENMGIKSVSFDSKGSITINTETIEIRLGQGEHLEEKLGLAGVLLKKLDGKSGILHLEDYDGTNGNRSFESN